MSSLERLASFCHAQRTAPLPADVMQEAKTALLDYAASLLWGTRHELFGRLKSYAAGRPAGPSRLPGFPDGLRAEDAAFIAGVVSHCMEIDDVHLGTTGFHPGATIISAALALGQELRSTGEEVLRAIVLGYEAAGRIGKSMTPQLRYRGFHATGVIGVFGAACAASVLTGLDAGGIRNAMALASAQAGGTFAFLDGGGTDIKYLHAGNAARAGVECSRLAQAGFEGPPRLLESREGFVHAYAGTFDPEKITAGLGDTYEIRNLLRKRYFICGHIFSAMDAIGQFAPDRRNPRDIASVEVRAYKAASVLDHKRPANFPEAKFSIPYCLASYLLHGEVVDAYGDPDKLNGIFQLADRVHVEEDPAMTAAFPGKRLTSVTIRRTDGTVQTETVEYPSGTPQNPVDFAALRGKFAGIAEPAFGREAAERLLRQLEEFERVRDAAAFMEELTSAFKE